MARTPNGMQLPAARTSSRLQVSLPGEIDDRGEDPLFRTEDQPLSTWATKVGRPGAVG